MYKERKPDHLTIIWLLVGLLIGGLLVWAFSGPPYSPTEQERCEQYNNYPLERLPAKCIKYYQ